MPQPSKMWASAVRRRREDLAPEIPPLAAPDLRDVEDRPDPQDGPDQHDPVPRQDHGQQGPDRPDDDVESGEALLRGLVHARGSVVYSRGGVHAEPLSLLPLREKVACAAGRMRVERRRRC